jgi:hypothetical protein
MDAKEQQEGSRYENQSEYISSSYESAVTQK